jgi:hypothetical protein
MVASQRLDLLAIWSGLAIPRGRGSPQVDPSCISASIRCPEAADGAAPGLLFVGSIQKCVFKANTLHYMIALPVLTFEELTAYERSHER